MIHDIHIHVVVEILYLGIRCHIGRVWQSYTPSTPSMCRAKRIQLQQLQLQKKHGVGVQLHVFLGAPQGLLKKN